jgi:hypothetical protein
MPIACSRTLLSCFALLLSILHLPAQPRPLHFQPANDIAVTLFQNQLFSPWSGGMNAVQLSALPLDGDSLPDLLLFDRIGNRVLPMVYAGPPGSTDYRFDPQYLSAFPPLRDWVLARDYDNDGQPDLFTGSEGGIRVYRNVSADSGRLAFLPYPQPLLRTLKANGNKDLLKVFNRDVPAIADLDGDGDLDLLTFEPLGLRIEYHRNYSQEQLGHPDSLRFQLEEDCWGHVVEDGVVNLMVLNAPCKTDGKSERVHAGGTILTFDRDGDGDHEALVGDIGFKDLVLLTNGGTPQHADITAQTTSFPASRPVFMDLFPAAYFLDIDQDGKRDLVVCPNSTAEIENRSSLWWYRNTGTDASPVFSYETDRLLQSDALDFGSGAYPLLTDYTLDGKPDLLCGNYGVYSFGDYQPQLAIFRNSGSPASAAFDLVEEAIIYLDPFSYGPHAAPAFADLDGDGDFDLVLGKGDGTLELYRNFAFQPNAIYPSLVLQGSNWLGADVGAFATPCLFDYDGDSLPDLFVGAQNGRLAYYRNQGSAAQPDFVWQSDSFGGINVSAGPFQPGYSAPAFFRWDGVVHCWVGSEQGTLYLYADTLAQGSFALLDSLRFQGRRSAPAVADLDGDSIPDLIVGNLAGGLSLFYASAPARDTQLVALRDPLPAPALRLAPNPARTHLRLSWEHPAPAEVQIFDLAGRIIYQTQARSVVEVNVLAWPPGIYLASVRTRAGCPMLKRFEVRR